ncbi:hypothetical protein EXIGLDRAFT_774513 [Exidia glandulosa HHB12029]|uniref:Uncharacterized protein n=1 Tax=Exidia glandulosa HHB12029 TaxID=1314781 RepID=A0A165ZXH1_EXIGL|nr:hypothetical protein EXIGLDRAFT_774513 [Exidia glandulosa HHB12029]
MLARPIVRSTTRALLARRYTLDVKLPDISRDPQAEALEPQAKVPFVYDFWDSKAKNAAAAAQAAAEAAATTLPGLPKVITAAGTATHLGGGPSSNAYEPPIEQAQPVIRTAGQVSGVWGGLADDIGLPSTDEIRNSLAKITDPASTPPLPKSKDLTEDDKKGLWMLVGLIAGGWIAGGIFSPRKRTQEH